jgi:hypothetical protein
MQGSSNQPRGEVATGEARAAAISKASLKLVSNSVNPGEVAIVVKT